MLFPSVGIYAGTFDPIHEGHIAFGLEVLRVCNLDKVLLLPEQIPRGKQRVTDISHRIALLHATVNSIAGLDVATLPVRQFTIADTLPMIQAQFPSANLTLLIGSDIVRGSLRTWENLDVLVASVSFAIGMRRGDDPAEIKVTMAELGAGLKTPVRYTIVTTDQSEIASSHVRAGKTAALNPNVASYIQAHNLYS